ncbi:holin [Streptomyces sp. NPDC002431]
MSDLSLPPQVDTVLKSTKTYARDLVERVVATFLQTFVGALVLTQPFDLAMWQAAAVAGVAAVGALLKGLVARWRDVTNSASLARGV